MSTYDLVKSTAGESKERKPPFGTGFVPPAVSGSRSERLFFSGLGFSKSGILSLLVFLAVSEILRLLLMLNSELIFFVCVLKC